MDHGEERDGKKSGNKPEGPTVVTFTSDGGGALNGSNRRLL
jgi:hypothetical protein